MTERMQRGNKSMTFNYDMWKSTDPWWEEGYYDMCEKCEEEVGECECEEEEGEKCQAEK